MSVGKELAPGGRRVKRKQRRCSAGLFTGTQIRVLRAPKQLCLQMGLLTSEKPVSKTNNCRQLFYITQTLQTAGSAWPLDHLGTEARTLTICTRGGPSHSKVGKDDTL
jgi:hypothetical protein